MNVLTIVVLACMVFKLVDGFRKGMVKEIISFVSLIILCVVLLLIGNGLQSYMEGEFLSVAVMVVLLVVIGLIHHLLGVVFFSAKIISKLPIIHSVDKLLGMLVGVLEVILFMWTVYAYIIFCGLGMIGQQIVEYTSQSPVLSVFYQYNLLVPLVNSLLTKMAA